MNRDDPPDDPLPPHGTPPRSQPVDLLPCHVCGEPTSRASLSAFGARCRRCFEDYARSRKPAPQGDTPVQREMRAGRRLFRSDEP